MGVEVRGVTETCANLDAFSVEIREKILAKAVRAGAKIIQRAVIERTPIQEVKSPGSDSLGPGVLQGDIGVKVFKPAEDVESGIIGPRYYAYVARWVEYGHANIRGGYSRLIGSGPNAGSRRGPGKEVGDRTPPHPFIRPAFEASVNEATRKVIETLRSGIASAARRARKR